MILDTSAVVAIVRTEPASDWLVDRMQEADSLAMGAPTLVETELVLTGRMRPVARTILERFVLERNVAVLPFDEEHWREAGRAFLRFGKGRHPARLNLGDCMTYATARLSGEPLLCLGDDFAQTDLDIVHP